MARKIAYGKVLWMMTPKTEPLVTGRDIKNEMHMNLLISELRTIVGKGYFYIETRGTDPKLAYMYFDSVEESRAYIIPPHILSKMWISKKELSDIVKGQEKDPSGMYAIPQKVKDRIFDYFSFGNTIDLDNGDVSVHGVNERADLNLYEQSGNGEKPCVEKTSQKKIIFKKVTKK